jgi:uncharacterized membrane protein HdeD (DUF308 family)
MLAGGGLTVLFAIMIGRHFPTSAEWLVGTLFGVSLLLNGYTAISVAGAARTVARKAERA